MARKLIFVERAGSGGREAVGVAVNLLLPRPLRAGGALSWCSLDLDGDGACEVIALKRVEGGQRLTVYRWHGFGLEGVRTVPLRRRVESICLGDFDGDGKVEAMGASPDGRPLLLLDDLTVPKEGRVKTGRNPWGIGGEPKRGRCG